MTKKYYWLKLKSDFFDDDTIRYIEEQENGIAYSNFYLKLCLKSLQSEGKLIRLVGNTLIPYDAKSLAKLTNVDIDTVVVAMNLFKQIGLVEVLESGEIYLSQINEMIGSETDKARLMRRLRAEKNSKKLLDSNNVTQVLQKCYTEIEIRDRDKEIENRDKDIEKDIPAPNDLKNHSVPAIIELPLNDKTLFPLFTDNIKEYEELYPAVDVLQELRKMKGWLNANPTKRKTKRGIARFINSWLSREQDRGHYDSPKQKEHRNTDFDEFD